MKLVFKVKIYSSWNITLNRVMPIQILEERYHIIYRLSFRCFYPFIWLFIDTMYKVNFFYTIPFKFAPYVHRLILLYIVYNYSFSTLLTFECIVINTIYEKPVLKNVTYFSFVFLENMLLYIALCCVILLSQWKSWLWQFILFLFNVTVNLIRF